MSENQSSDPSTSPLTEATLAPPAGPPILPPPIGAPMPAHPMPPMGSAVPFVRKQGAWGLWWLCAITFGIYYFVWYQRINNEICAVLRTVNPGNGKWWSQIIPIYGLVGLHQTAKRVNAAHTLVGSPTRVSPFVTWFWAPSWFASQTRYLQRRINILHDVLASHARG